MEFPDSTKNLLGNRNYFYILFSLEFLLGVHNFDLP